MTELVQACPVYSELKRGINREFHTQMNQTRVEWSTFGCARIYSMDIAVWVNAAAMVTLTLAFYVAARFSQNPQDSEIIEGERHIPCALSGICRATRLTGQHRRTRFLMSISDRRTNTAGPNVENLRKRRERTEKLRFCRSNGSQSRSKTLRCEPFRRSLSRPKWKPISKFDFLLCSFEQPSELDDRKLWPSKLHCKSPRGVCHLFLLRKASRSNFYGAFYAA